MDKQDAIKKCKQWLAWWKRSAVRVLKASKKYFFPGNILTIFLVILSTGLLIYSLGFLGANPVVAYISYALSAYTLTVVVIKMPPIIRRIRQGLHNNKYSGRYLAEAELRARLSLYVGFILNTVYAVLKLLAGIHFRSIWIGAVAVYYMILSLMRFGLMKQERYNQKFEDSTKQQLHGLQSYRFCGCLMFLLNIAMTGLVVQMIWQNKTYRYPGLLIYAFAAYTFYCMVRAIINMVKYRKMERPVLSAAKMLSFACALMAVLALQTAMLTQFGEGEGQESFIRLMNSLTGSAVCLSVFIMAVWMIRRANRELVKIRRMENHGE